VLHGSGCLYANDYSVSMTLTPSHITYKKFLLSLACFSFSILSVSAQEIFSGPPAKRLSVFKYEQLSGGVILLRATLDNFQDSLNFILDTGSGGISLDSITAAELGVQITPSDRTIRGIAGIRQVFYALHHTLNLPGIKVDSLDFHINDYNLLTAVYGIRIDGIIGFSLLRRYIVHVDFNLTQLSFYSPGTFKYSRGGTLLRPAFNNLPIQSATVKDNTEVRHRFYIDTGGGLCLLLSQDFVDDSSVFAKTKKMVATMAEGLGGKKPMMITTTKELKLGPYKFKKVPTYVFSDEFNVTNYPNLGGLLGADLLRRFNLTINYPRGEIHLQPNAHFRDPFDYSYTGMEIYYEAGKILVGEVMKDSPAETAGLMVGDLIISVDNVISSSFQVIKNMLQNAGKKLSLVIIRNGFPQEIKIKVASFK